MTSQINPNNIDGEYPIAGVSNNTQGMRDNFTNIKTNFQYAEDEIDDLQSKGVFKAALTGTTLDNNMADNLIYAVKLNDVSYTWLQNTATSGTITLDYAASNYQYVSTTGSVSLGFTNWPAAGSVGELNFTINITNTAYTLTLPSSVNTGLFGIQGISPGTAGVSNTITFGVTGEFSFRFTSEDGGISITIFDYSRGYDRFYSTVEIQNNTVSTSPTTGALTVAGGVGIQGNLYVNGDIFGNVTLTDISVNTVTAVGNVVGGNILTGGIVSATGNITGGNMTAVTVVTAPRIVTNSIRSDDSSFVTIEDGLNVEQGLVISGDLDTVGNITGGNVLGGANVNATTHTGTTVSVSGNITGGNVLSSAVVSAVGAATILSGTAVPPGGTVGAGYKFSSVANFGVFFGSGAPSLVAAKGSLYLRSDGSTTNDRMYVNTDGAATWTNVVTSA